MRVSLATLALGAALAFSFAARAADPSVDDVLKKVDEALFFHDKQEKLAGYDVEVVSCQASPAHGKPADAPKVEKGAKGDKISFDAATGKKKHTDVSGADVPPGSLRPSCGPWTLTAVMAFEVELFAKPFSATFDAASYDRACEKTDAGFRLKLTPKAPLGEAGFLKPAITGIELELDGDGVPKTGVLHLDQKIMKEDGKLVFTFGELKGKKKKRIERIESTITSANLKINPVLTFKFADKAEPLLPQLIEFRVPGADLSGTLAGIDQVTFFVFTNLKLKKAK